MATNDMDYAANDADNYEDETYFEREHYQVFLVHVPALQFEQFRRFLYVELNCLHLGTHTGHKFQLRAKSSALGGSSAQNTLLDQTCSHPYVSYAGAELRLISWVHRGKFEEFRQFCGEVSRIEHGCCHTWTNAAIDALHEARLLLPLRQSDDGSICCGPHANVPGQTTHDTPLKEAEILNVKA